MRSRTLSLIAVPLLGLALSAGLAQADLPTPTFAPDVAAGDAEQQLERANRDIAALESELERTRGQSDRVRRRMSARGRTWYRMVHAGLLPLGAGFDTLLSHTSKAERLRRALVADAQEAAGLTQLEQALSQRRQRLIERRASLDVQVKAMAQAKLALLESEDRKRAFERAFASSAEPTDYMAIYGAAVGPAGPAGPDGYETAASFRELKGRMPFPLAGRAEVRAVSRAGAGGPGIEMVSAPGTPVRTVFGGRVAFADEYSEYGRVVIVDHGENYFTVSGNLGTIEVKVGDEVGTGSRIGTVGAAGPRGVLYFELRHGPDTLDPTPWMGI